MGKIMPLKFSHELLFKNNLRMRCEMEIRRAEMKDLKGVMDLHKQYHVDSINPADKPDGFVTTNFTPEQLQALVEKERGITIAKDGERVI